MAVWTLPRTWAVGELVTASMMNTHLRDNAQFLFDTAPKTIRGHITAGGGQSNGGGFTCVRNSAGQYTIAFVTAFVAPPAVQVTAIYNGAAIDAMINGVPTVSGFPVICISTGAVPTDNPFSFTAQEKGQ